MRLLVQRCLILGLCLFSTLSVAGFPTLPDGAVVFWTKTASKNYTSESGTVSSPSETMRPQAEARRDDCESNHPDKVCVVQTFDDPPEVRYVANGVTYYRWNGGARMVAAPAGYCEPPSYLSNEGVCITPDQPEECHENGEAYDPESQQCVTECEHGVLNGTCLPPPEEPNECNSDSSDYRGQIVQGYGKSPINFCGDIDQCSGDKPGQIGLVNGKLRCIANDYGAPKCKGESITVIDEYGFVCEPLTNQPEEPETPEAPNTDTDGDGEPDEYQRENDPESIDKGLDNVEKAIREGNAKTDKSNQHLGNIENAVKRIADDVSSLEQMGKNGELSGGGGGASGGGEGLKNDDGEDYLGDLADIKQNTKDTADGIDTLNEKLDDPEAGYSTDELESRVPTFEQSADRLYNTLVSNPTIEAVTTIPELASNNTCPVYTMPSTAYWSAMTIDVHCTILNEHRGTLSTVFLIVWTLTAIMVFLRA